MRMLGMQQERAARTHPAAVLAAETPRSPMPGNAKRESLHRGCFRARFRARLRAGAEFKRAVKGFRRTPGARRHRKLPRRHPNIGLKRTTADAYSGLCVLVRLFNQLLQVAFQPQLCLGFGGSCSQLECRAYALEVPRREVDVPYRHGPITPAHSTTSLAVAQKRAPP